MKKKSLIKTTSTGWYRFIQHFLEILIKQLAKEENVTENLKATNQLEWVQKMNNIKNRAEEIVLNELIYN